MEVAKAASALAAQFAGSSRPMIFLNIGEPDFSAPPLVQEAAARAISQGHTQYTQATGLPVGYSDHSQGVEAALASVALGAALIEKHLTLDKGLPGPDHLASADPQEFAAMVRGIRLVEAMRGDGVKQPTVVEANTRDVARRSVVLAAARPRGHVLTAADLVLRRPGTGIQPEHLAALPGRRRNADVAADPTLHWDLLESA